MNKVYPSFVATCMASVFGESVARDAPDFFFYALNGDYVYDDAHVSLDDVPVESRVAKSDPIALTLEGDASVLIEDMVNAFNGLPLSAIQSIIMVAEWADDSLLIVFMNEWVNTGLPFTAPSTVDMKFVDNFVFRLGSVGRDS